MSTQTLGSPGNDHVISPDTSFEHDGPQTDSPDSSFGQSPSASAYLRAEKTLAELAGQLSCLGVNEADAECSEGCAMSEKLALSAEIGAALLQRCEAMEKKHDYESKRCQHQLSVKRKALSDCTQRLQSLERANSTHLSRYSELNRRHEALEKRYTQSIHDHTLTQQALSHVRAELSAQRTRIQRQSISLAMAAGANAVEGAGGWEDKLLEVQQRLDAVRDDKQVAVVAQRESERRSKRLEARVEELEQQLTIARAELEETKEARRGDARALLSNAKERLDTLHKELSETFRADDPEQTPEYQIAMENLVASNTMLKHDASELSHLLAESRDEVRVLRDEVEELRSCTANLGRISPAMLSHPHLAAEILSASITTSSTGSNTSRPASAAHVRTESSPMISSGTFTAADRAQWAQYQQQQHQKRISVSSSRFGSVTDYAHVRKSSLAPSFASTSTTDGITSPGLGYGSIGEYSGQLMRDSQTQTQGQTGPMSPTVDGASSGRESPRLGFRSSTSGGIGYVLNGVPKAKRPGVNRSISERPKRASGQWGLRGVDTISEQPLSDVADGHTTDEPLSPSSEYYRAADMSRKRRSLMLARHSSVSPHGSTDYNVSVSGTTFVDGLSEVASPVDGTASIGLPRIDTTGPKQSPAKKHNRRTLLLLTKNKGVQAHNQSSPGSGTGQELSIELTLSAKMDDMPLLSAVDASVAAAEPITQLIPSGLTSPNAEDHSETSSLHLPGGIAGGSGTGHILSIVDHLSKLLNRLRAADIPSLNRRLRKQHLPGDVAHLSRSTLQTLSREIGELKTHSTFFRPLLDINSAASVSRREWTALVKLLRDVFDEMVDMQALINDVTLNPKLAKRLQKDAYREDDEVVGASEAGAAAPGVGGLGWIANPITRLFVTPAVPTQEEDQAQTNVSGGRIDRTRLKPDTPIGRTAPKQAAVASATTTHVEVGFGGAGMPTRGRVVPASSTSSVPQLSPAEKDGDSREGPSAGQSRTVSAASGLSIKSQQDVGITADVHGPNSGGLMPPQPTLRRAKSRANRNELLGIFAGAQAAKGGLGQDTLRAPGRTLRTQSSQYFDRSGDTASANMNSGTIRKARESDRTIRAKQSRMSQGVDAVLDPHGQGRDGLGEVFGDSAVEEGDEPSFQPLLYRTLRPRGNSDSSIRSTFISHAITEGVPHLPIADTGAPTIRQGGYGYGGLLAGLRGKLWATAPAPAAGSGTAPLAPAVKADAGALRASDAMSTASEYVSAADSNIADTSSLTASSMSRSVSTGTTIPVTLSSKPVSIARSHSSTGSAPSAASPRSHGQSPSQTKNGILGYIASSLGGEALLDPESDGHGQFGGGRSPGRMGRAEEEDMMRAALRQGSGVARRHTRWE